MSFGYQRNSGIGSFSSYADALDRYENTTDIRGRVEEPKRPLGHRKNVDMYSIRKADNGDIECVLYRTPVITFHTDNTVSVRAEGWASQTTANFIPEVMGYGVSARIFNHRLCLYLYGNEYFLDGHEVFKLHKENGEWVATNPKQRVVHYIKRKESNNVMTRCKAFVAYLESMKKLRFDGTEAVFTAEEFEQCFGKDTGTYRNRRLDITLDKNHAESEHSFAKFKAWVEDTGEDCHLGYYKAMLMLVNAVSYSDWHTDQRVMRPKHWLEAKNLLKNVMWGLYRDEVFTEMPVANGVLKKDNYGRFYEGGWQKYHEMLKANA